MVKKSSYLSFLNRQKQKLRKSSRKNPTYENVAKYKAASLKFDSKVKKSSQKYEQSIIESGNTTRLFSYIMKKLKFHQGIGPIENKFGDLAYDNKKKADLFSELFSGVFTKSNGKIPDFNILTNKTVADIEFDPPSIWKC